MSARAERPFLPTLREIDRALAVSIPERVAILRELEFDLEELRARLEAEGLTTDEARARALDVLSPDGATLRELERLRTPVYVRLTRGLPGDRLRVIERAALALATLSVLLIEAGLLLDADLRVLSPYIWLVLALGALLFATIAGKAFELWIRRDHRRPERGLVAILVLAAATVAAGAGGAFGDLYMLANRIEGGGAPASTLAVEWLVRSCGVVAVALLIAMAGGLAWFVLAHWLALVSGEHGHLLGIVHTTNSTTR